MLQYMSQKFEIEENPRVQELHALLTRDWAPYRQNLGLL